MKNENKKVKGEKKKLMQTKANLCPGPKVLGKAKTEQHTWVIN